MSRTRIQFSLRLLLIAITGIAIALSILVATRNPVINRSTYERIEVDMSQAEVNELLQTEPLDLAPLSFDDVAYDEERARILDTEQHPWPHTQRSWKSGNYMISVHFDANGRVVAKYFKRSPDASAIDRFADWLRL